MTSAPALSQNTTTRRHGFFRARSATASNESKRHPDVPASSFASRATRLRASAKVSARRAASRIEPQDSSSATAAASATPCTAAAAPASNKLPARQHSSAVLAAATLFAATSSRDGDRSPAHLLVSVSSAFTAFTRIFDVGSSSSLPFTDGTIVS